MHTKNVRSKRILLSVLLLGLIVLPPAQAQPSPGSLGDALAIHPPASSVSPILPLATRSAFLVVKTQHFEAGRQSALDSASQCGAEVIDTQTSLTEKGRKKGQVQFRLPAATLPEFLARLRTLGTLSGERFSAQDKTTEVGSLAKRVQRLQQHEMRLGTLLAGERRLRGSDILYVQERLFRASVDESLLTQRREDLQRHGQTCLVTLTLYEPVEITRTAQARRAVAHSFADGLGFAGAWASALVARALTLLAYIVVLAPAWIGILLGGWLAARQLKRYGHRRKIARS